MGFEGPQEADGALAMTSRVDESSVPAAGASEDIAAVAAVSSSPENISESGFEGPQEAERALEMASRVDQSSVTAAGATEGNAADACISAASANESGFEGPQVDELTVTAAGASEGSLTAVDESTTAGPREVNLMAVDESAVTAAGASEGNAASVSNSAANASDSGSERPQEAAKELAKDARVDELTLAAVGASEGNALDVGDSTASASQLGFEGPRVDELTVAAAGASEDNAASVDADNAAASESAADNDSATLVQDGAALAQDGATALQDGAIMVLHDRDTVLHVHVLSAQGDDSSSDLPTEPPLKADPEPAPAVQAELPPAEPILAEPARSEPALSEPAVFEPVPEERVAEEGAGGSQEMSPGAGAEGSTELSGGEAGAEGECVGLSGGEAGAEGECVGMSGGEAGAEGKCVGLSGGKAATEGECMGLSGREGGEEGECVGLSGGEEGAEGECVGLSGGEAGAEAECVGLSGGEAEAERECVGPRIGEAGAAAAAEAAAGANVVEPPPKAKEAAFDGTGPSPAPPIASFPSYSAALASLPLPPMLAKPSAFPCASASATGASAKPAAPPILRGASVRPVNHRRPTSAFPNSPSLPPIILAPSPAAALARQFSALRSAAAPHPSAIDGGEIGGPGRRDWLGGRSFSDDSSSSSTSRMSQRSQQGAARVGGGSGTGDCICGSNIYTSSSSGGSRLDNGYHGCVASGSGCVASGSSGSGSGCSSSSAEGESRSGGLSSPSPHSPGRSNSHDVRESATERSLGCRSQSGRTRRRTLSQLIEELEKMRLRDAQGEAEAGEAETGKAQAGEEVVGECSGNKRARGVAERGEDGGQEARRELRKRPSMGVGLRADAGRTLSFQGSKAWHGLKSPTFRSVGRGEGEWVNARFPLLVLSKSISSVWRRKGGRQRHREEEQQEKRTGELEGEKGERQEEGKGERQERTEMDKEGEGGVACKEDGFSSRSPNWPYREAACSHTAFSHTAFSHAAYSHAAYSHNLVFPETGPFQAEKLHVSSKRTVSFSHDLCSNQSSCSCSCNSSNICNSCNSCNNCNSSARLCPDKTCHCRSLATTGLKNQELPLTHLLSSLQAASVSATAVTTNNVELSPGSAHHRALAEAIGVASTSHHAVAAQARRAILSQLIGELEAIQPGTTGKEGQPQEEERAAGKAEGEFNRENESKCVGVTSQDGESSDDDEDEDWENMFTFSGPVGVEKQRAKGRLAGECKEMEMGAEVGGVCKQRVRGAGGRALAGHTWQAWSGQLLGGGRRLFGRVPSVVQRARGGGGGGGGGGCGDGGGGGKASSHVWPDVYGCAGLSVGVGEVKDSER
ncbi:unnamed protein product [Closterium sp. NIES-54]